MEQNGWNRYGLRDYIACEIVGSAGNNFVLKCTDTRTGEVFGATYSPVKEEVKETYPWWQAERILAIQGK